MQNPRLFLWISFAFVLFLIFQAWQRDYPTQPSAPSVPAEAPAPSTQDPGGELPDISDTPAETETAAPELAEQTAPTHGRIIRVQTDVMKVEMATHGGSLLLVELLDYTRRNGGGEREPVTLLDDSFPDGYFIATGLRVEDVSSEPNHLAVFSSSQDAYRLEDDEDEVEVPLSWRNTEGIVVSKIYTFRRGSYAIELTQELNNGSDSAVRAASYAQILRDYREIERSMFNVETFSFTGPVVFDGDKYEKLDYDDLIDEPVREQVTGGWVAMIQHHFLSALVPNEAEEATLDLRIIEGPKYRLRTVGPARIIEPGASYLFAQKLFVGPKLQEQLEASGPKLELTVDYGLTTVIAQPLYWVLKNINRAIGNWGWSIVLLTILIKIVFYKLAETSGRSIAKMRKLQPRIKALQERYKDDRQKLSQAVMELYKTEKANPAAGCLPVLVQMPVFFALYWVLIESVELRGAPWILWIHDLSLRDPYFVLPVLMGVSMWGMQKLHQQPADPVQAKVMAFMPVMLTGLMAFFPAGLVLYWLVNNLLSALQQWRINKVVERER